MATYSDFIDNSPTLSNYKKVLKECVGLYYLQADPRDIDAAINYSIEKRFKDSNKVRIVNSYKRYRDENDNYVDLEQQVTLKKISDYIISREPIVTSNGVMFKHHGVEPNPMNDVIQLFLKSRGQYKDKMFEFPKGSEDFEKYNLLQQLAKIDANGSYGTIGAPTSLLYNSNVASSITSQGRSAVSTMTLHFEMILNNNVKFGSLNEVVEFINNVVKEEPLRQYDDYDILNHLISPEECFAKLILSCGYRWIPNEEEMDIIWKIVNNLGARDLNRIYYKNNLFEFCSNEKVFNIIKAILHKLEQPLLASTKVPPEVEDDMIYFRSLIMEYVYYRYLFIDRIDRCDNMIKSVTMVSDTDSTIISLDGWYRYVVERVKGEKFKISNETDHPEMKEEPKELTEKVLDYDFNTDEIIEIEQASKPDKVSKDKNVLYSIINILVFCLDKTVNDYMEKFCSNNHSLDGIHHNSCKIWAKTEFLRINIL